MGIRFLILSHHASGQTVCKIAINSCRLSDLQVNHEMSGDNNSFDLTVWEVLWSALIFILNHGYRVDPSFEVELCNSCHSPGMFYI